MPPRICVCSLLLGRTALQQASYAAMMEPMIATHRAYCSRWGYDYVCPTSLAEVHPRATTEPVRPFSWYKILLVSRLLDTYDYVLWVDSDAKIQRMDIPLTGLLGRIGSENVALINECDVDGVRHIQCGVMLFARRPHAKAWLDKVWAQTQYITHVWWEQQAIIHLHQTDPAFRDGLILLPPELPVLQCFPLEYAHPDALIMHFAGRFRSLMN